MAILLAVSCLLTFINEITYIFEPFLV